MLSVVISKNNNFLESQPSLTLSLSLSLFAEWLVNIFAEIKIWERDHESVVGKCRYYHTDLQTEARMIFSKNSQYYMDWFKLNST